MKRKKITTLRLRQMKEKGEKISMLTAYDHPTARIMDDAGIDIILVGDSVGNTMLGYPDTIPVTMDQMISHTTAVCKAVKYALVVGDMPFMSYQISVEDAVKNAGRFIKEARAHSIKLEGGVQVADRVAAIVNAGIPVMGHLGLTPQSVNMLGGYRVQGKNKAQAQKMLDDARCLEDAGVFAILLELMPAAMGKLITDSISVPTVGIGAGPHTSGQILIYHDMVGIEAVFQPKFVKKYAALEETIHGAISNYVEDVRSGAFPSPEHCFDMDEEELKDVK
jgi:3-methyl-2-oxobutanoate hydroxymethyltransferase